MLGRTQGARLAPGKAAAQPSFPMQRLWRQAMWGSAAAMALLVAILAGRSGDTGSPRGGTTLSFMSSSPSSALRPAQGTPSGASQMSQQATAAAAPRPPEPDPAVRQLTLAVRALAEDRDKVLTRLTAVERSMDDMTGSIGRQIEEAKAASARAAAKASPPWPSADAPSVELAPTTLASVALSAMPPPEAAPAATTPPAGSPTTADAHASGEAGPAYGADLGAGLSIKALNARWASLRTTHASLLEGLGAVAALRDNPRSNKISLHLVIGPFANAEGAAQLCVSLAAIQVACQPSMFDSAHLALQ